MKVHLFFVLFYFFANTVCFAQPTFSITLRVEDTTAYTAYHNEPLIFTTSVTNDTLQQNIEWNEEADDWLKQVAADYKAGKLSKEEFEKETQLVTEGKKEVKIAMVGNRQSPWFQQLQFRVSFGNDKKEIFWPILIPGDPLTDSIATLDENGYYQVRHYLSPLKVARQKPGIYTIQVLLAGVLSNSVKVKLMHEIIPVRVLKTAQMQLRLGNYYLDRKNANKALIYAQAVLKKDPANINGLVLCGESYILRKNYKRALACFEKALQQHKIQFPDLLESPIYLLGTIAWLEKNNDLLKVLLPRDYAGYSVR